jgi:putative endonuclease
MTESLNSLPLCFVLSNQLWPRVQARHPARSCPPCCTLVPVILREVAGSIHQGHTMSKQAFVYILANKKNGTLYIGVTCDLLRRIYEHKIQYHKKCFTAKYKLDKLVWYLAGDDIVSAIELEKKMKNRNRAWKVSVIEKDNPEWTDLSFNFLDAATLRSMTGSVARA